MNCSAIFLNTSFFVPFPPNVCLLSAYVVMRSLTFVSSHRSKIFNNPASPWLITPAKGPVETEEMVAENKESQKFWQIYRHLGEQCDIIFTRDILALKELQVSYKSHLPFIYKPQSWWGKLCKSKARKWHTEHSHI